jgi:hypothetical protein
LSIFLELENYQGVSMNFVNSILASMLVASFLAGCAAPPEKAWKKPGVSRHDSESAISECRYQLGVKKVAISEKNQLMKDCMQGKGFRLL